MASDSAEVGRAARAALGAAYCRYVPPPAYLRESALPTMTSVEGAARMRPMVVDALRELLLLARADALIAHDLWLSCVDLVWLGCVTEAQSLGLARACERMGRQKGDVSP